MRRAVGRRAVLAVGAMLICISHSAAVTYEELMTADEGNRKSYLAGMGAGFVWANAFAETVLYCQPMHLKLNGPNYVEIIDGYLKRTGQTDLTKQPIELLLLKALQDTFPCKDE